MSIRQYTRSRGFTLVELLLVIAILGVLAALGSYAVFHAIPPVREGVVKSEIGQIAMKLEMYKQEHGEYPPDFSDQPAVMRHIKKRWPNHKYADFADVAKAIKDSSSAHNSSYAWDASKFEHAGALAFWLGGFPDDNDTLAGFAADPQYPFKITVVNGEESSQRLPPMGEFTIGKNVDLEISNGEIPMIMFREAPLAYFVSSSSGTYYETGHSHGDGDSDSCVKHVDLDFGGDNDFGTAAPYAKEVSGTGASQKIKWHEPKKFQIVHTGLDGKFSGADSGSLRVSSDETGIDIEDRDNILSFTEKPRLDSILD